MLYIVLQIDILPKISLYIYPSLYSFPLDPLTKILDLILLSDFPDLSSLPFSLPPHPIRSSLQALLLPEVPFWFCLLGPEGVG